MKSVDRLIAEHDIILRGLDVLEKVVARIDSLGPVPEDFCTWAPGFFAQFADRFHHVKEEEILFPLLKERGIPEDGGPIGVMLHEHDVGRDCVRRMRDASESDEFDGGMFAAAARELILLLRQHILKENNILFPMATRVMSEADDADMDQKFSQVEQRLEIAGMRERCGREVARWEQEIQ